MVIGGQIAPGGCFLFQTPRCNQTLGTAGKKAKDGDYGCFSWNQIEVKFKNGTLVNVDDYLDAATKTALKAQIQKQENDWCTLIFQNRDCYDKVIRDIWFKCGDATLPDISILISKGGAAGAVGAID